MAPELIPALLCQDETSFHDRLKMVESEVPWVQVDILDGTLYANTSWADAHVISTWHINTSLELHLMVEDPAHIISTWNTVTSFRRAIWHIEAKIDHTSLIQAVRNTGREVGLAIAPSTPLEKLTPYLADIDRVLILGVEPGWSGQPLIPTSLEHVRQLQKQTPHPTISFDGGVTEETLPGIIKAGAESICASSLIFNHPPIPERLQEIRAKLDKESV
ncbi:hypothetical protein KBD61_03385 [Patescibacteria group bacterium]|nr:hypothetical protein [Patescibacteria group bacterium]MBP9710039.1 hypothetical protein [Patescibacteria group bacterium]